MEEDFLGDVELREIPILPFLLLSSEPMVGANHPRTIISQLVGLESSPNWWDTTNFIRTCPPSIVQRGSQI